MQLASRQMTNTPGSVFFWRNALVCFQPRNHLWSTDVRAFRCFHLLKLSKFQLVLASQTIWWPFQLICIQFLAVYKMRTMCLFTSYQPVLFLVIFPLEAYYASLYLFSNQTIRILRHGRSSSSTSCYYVAIFGKLVPDARLKRLSKCFFDALILQPHMGEIKSHFFLFYQFWICS